MIIVTNLEMDLIDAAADYQMLEECKICGDMGLLKRIDIMMSRVHWATDAPDLDAYGTDSICEDCLTTQQI